MPIILVGLSHENGKLLHAVTVPNVVTPINSGHVYFERLTAVVY